MDWNKLTRLEVITEDGRQLVVRFNVRGIWPEVQDDGRTLKLYISSKKD